MSTEDDFDAWLDGMALIAGEPLDVESSQSEMAIDDVTASPVEQTIESSASRVHEPDQPPAPVDLIAEPRPEIGQVPPLQRLQGEYRSGETIFGTLLRRSVLLEGARNRV